MEISPKARGFVLLKRVPGCLGYFLQYPKEIYPEGRVVRVLELPLTVGVASARKALEEFFRESKTMPIFGNFDAQDEEINRARKSAGPLTWHRRMTEGRKKQFKRQQISALGRAHKVSRKFIFKSAEEVRRSGEKSRGPGSDKMQAALKKRNAWIFGRYKYWLNHQSPDTNKPFSRRGAKEQVQDELKKKDFLPWRGTGLSIKTINKILRSRPSPSK